MLKFFFSIVIAVLTFNNCLANSIASVQDKIILEMRNAYLKHQNAKLTELLPQARGHKLESWAAYWELTRRLKTASEQEVNNFFTKYPNSYQEDRLRNDWLLELGRQKRWQTFLHYRPAFIMNDDKQVDCYTLMAEHFVNQKDVKAELIHLWQNSSARNLACEQAAMHFVTKKQINSDLIWHKIQHLTKENYLTKSKLILGKINPALASEYEKAIKKPAAYLTALNKIAQLNSEQKHLASIALIRLNRDDPLKAANALTASLNKKFNKQQQALIWGNIAQSLTFRQNPLALTYYQKANIKYLPDLNLEWRARAALRSQNWPEVISSILNMSKDTQHKDEWQYWLAIANQKTTAPTEQVYQNAVAVLNNLATKHGYYSLLAKEQLKANLEIHLTQPPIQAKEAAWVKQQVGLQKSLYAYKLGLLSESIREWNFNTVLQHQQNPLTDEQLIAAAQLACDNQAWYLCINTSERTKQAFNWQQRYPTPFVKQIKSLSASQNLDPGLVYGLIRQESRFAPDIRSSAGAAGLMQVMPATAKWTANKIGLTNYTPSLITDPTTNISLGTAYLRKVLDRFENSLPLAAAAYNAGPGRPEIWRQMPSNINSLAGALWIENIPFSETRNYVRQVLTNAVIYQHIMGHKTASLTQYLGIIYPKNRGLSSTEILP